MVAALESNWSPPERSCKVLETGLARVELVAAFSSGSESGTLVVPVQMFDKSWENL